MILLTPWFSHFAYGNAVSDAIYPLLIDCKWNSLNFSLCLWLMTESWCRTETEWKHSIFIRNCDLSTLVVIVRWKGDCHSKCMYDTFVPPWVSLSSSVTCVRHIEHFGKHSCMHASSPQHRHTRIQHTCIIRTPTCREWYPRVIEDTRFCAIANFHTNMKIWKEKKNVIDRHYESFSAIFVILCQTPLVIVVLRRNQVISSRRRAKFTVEYCV